MYFVLGFFAICVMSKYIPFFKNRREKLYVFDLSRETVILRKLGFMMNELNPKSRKLITKKGAFAKEVNYQIDNDIWKLKTDFRPSTLEKKNSFLIFGAVEKNERVKNTFDIKCSLKKAQLDEIIKSNDVLITLNKFVEDETESKVKEFKNTAESSILLMEKLKEAKDQIADSMKGYGDGIIDAISLFSEIYGLDPDDIDENVVSHLLEQREIRKLESKKIRFFGGNGEKKKLSLIKVKNKESEDK